MRTARLARTYDLEIRYTLFPLHPDTPAGGMTLEELFGGGLDVDAAKKRMEGLMRSEGLETGNRTHTYNSRRAQEMAKWAETQTGGSAVHDALYHAYFVRGENLAVIDRLVEVAESIGLRGDLAREAVDSGAYAEAVDRDWQRSRTLGVTGVPTFVVGNEGVVGAQPYEMLERLVVGGGAGPRS